MPTTDGKGREKKLLELKADDSLGREEERVCGDNKSEVVENKGEGG